MSRKKRDRQRREKKRSAKYQSIKDKMRDIWPELAEALSDPSLAAELEKNGLVADFHKIRQLGEAGIFIAVASDGRAPVSNLKRKEI
jgi:hypothetical protein